MTGILKGINGGPCLYSDKGCTKIASAKGMCRSCYEKKRHGIEPMTGKMRGNRGSRVKDAKGYIFVYLPEHPMATGPYVLEHRLIMSEYLGRNLLDTENVHHKNGQKDDNRIENLELWSTAQPKGQKIQDKIDFAVSILETYAPDMLAQRKEGKNV